MEYLLTQLGTGVFAISGVLSAARTRLDIISIIRVGLLTALGGGTLRDIISIAGGVFRDVVTQRPYPIVIPGVIRHPYSAGQYPLPVAAAITTASHSPLPGYGRYLYLAGHCHSLADLQAAAVDVRGEGEELARLHILPPLGNQRPLRKIEGLSTLPSRLLTVNREPGLE